MKYIELKASLKNELKNAYLIFGEDRYLCFDSLKKIEGALGLTFKDMNAVTIQGGAVSAKDIVESANVYPFGDQYRLVVVKDFNPSKNKDDFKKIQDYLKAPLNSTILVFFNPEGSEFFKGMSDITLVDCGKIDTKVATAYIKNYLAKNDIGATDDAIEKLILFSLCDMTKINSELEKLSAYVAETKVLTTDIVEKFVVQDQDFQIYELAEFLAKGDAENAFKLIDSFMVKPGSAFQLISPLFNNYRRALFVSVNKDKTTQELANLLGVKEFAIKMLDRQIKAFSPKILKRIVDEIAEYDRKIKVGEIKENIAIKMIATSILTLRGKNG